MPGSKGIAIHVVLTWVLGAQLWGFPEKRPLSCARASVYHRGLMLSWHERKIECLLNVREFFPIKYLGEYDQTVNTLNNNMVL